MSDPRTERRALTTQAYGTDANLAARQSIYRFVDPPTSFPAWALDRVSWDGVRAVLDVGCGNGAYFRLLRERVGADATIVGFDLSAGMLTSARHDGAHLAVADVQAIPLPDASFDVALAMHMLYHAPDVELAIVELRRVLGPGGVLLAATNGEPHQRELVELFGEAAGLDSVDPLRVSSWRFGLDNGAELLSAAFDDVHREDLPATLVVPEVEPVLAYVASTRSWREFVLPDGLTWDRCMDRVREMVEARIERDGAMRITTHAGVFVCR